MRRLAKFSYLVFLLGWAPALAYGGLLDWLTGGIVKTVATTAQNITYAVVLHEIVQILAPYLPLVCFAVLGVSGVLCLLKAGSQMEDFQGAYKEANKDGRISWSEAGWLVMQYIPDVIIAGALVWFGGVLIYMASGGLLALAAK
jgi:hypothetical protein